MFATFFQTTFSSRKTINFSSKFWYFVGDEWKSNVLAFDEAVLGFIRSKAHNFSHKSFSLLLYICIPTYSRCTNPVINVSMIECNLWWDYVVQYLSFMIYWWQWKKSMFAIIIIIPYKKNESLNRADLAWS
jgi:hypothetical protein